MQIRSLTIDECDQLFRLWKEAGLSFKPRGETVDKR